LSRGRKTLERPIYREKKGGEILRQLPGKGQNPALRKWEREKKIFENQGGKRKKEGTGAGA